MHQRLWNRYALARGRLELEPTLRNESVALVAFAKFARAFCPDEADELIGVFCRHLKSLAVEECGA